MATAAPIEFELNEPKFLAVERSFRRLSSAEAGSIQFPRLQILVADRPSSYNRLAQGSALGAAGEDRLRLLNRDFPRGDIVARERIKQIIWDD